MSQPHKKPMTTSPLAIQPQQMRMAFEARPLLGLTAVERMKVLTHLANLLMQAAGVATKEHAHER